MADADQKDSTLRAFVVIPGSGMCIVGFPGDFSLRAVFLPFRQAHDAPHHARQACRLVCIMPPMDQKGWRVFKVVNIPVVAQRLFPWSSLFCRP